MENLPGNQVAEPVSPQKIKRRRQVLIFLFCIAIALVLWFLNALENRYQTDINHPVRFINLPDDYVLLSPLPRKLALEVEGLGFSILKHNWNLSKDPLIIDFREIKPLLPRNPVAFTDTVDLQRFAGSFSDVLGDLTVTGFRFSKLVLEMSSKNEPQ